MNSQTKSRHLFLVISIMYFLSASYYGKDFTIHWATVNTKHDQIHTLKRGILPEASNFFRTLLYMYKQTKLGDPLNPSITCCCLYNNPNALMQPA